LAEEKYRGIFENAVMGIFQTTVAGKYVSANLSLARIYGYESVEELKASVTNIERQLYVDPKRRTDFVEGIKQNGHIANFESEIYRKDGSIRWISENAREVRAADGTLLFYEGTIEETGQKLKFKKLEADAVREGVKGLCGDLRIRLSVKHLAVTRRTLCFEF